MAERFCVRATGSRMSRAEETENAEDFDKRCFAFNAASTRARTSTAPARSISPTHCASWIRHPLIG